MKSLYTSEQIECQYQFRMSTSEGLLENFSNGLVYGRQFIVDTIGADNFLKWIDLGWLVCQLDNWYQFRHPYK